MRATLISIAMLVGCAAFAAERPAIQEISVQPPAGPPIALQGGAESIDALIDRLIAALEKQDKAALARLRVSEEEYRRIIVPGRVHEGQPPRNPAKRNVDYFWSTMNFKSDLYADNMMKTFGGRKYGERKFEFSKPSNQWAWYTAYGELRMRMVSTEEDKKYLLQAGWIVEVGGVYKFLSYEYDS